MYVQVARYSMKKAYIMEEIDQGSLHPSTKHPETPAALYQRAI
jgi:hypothetical protein